MLFSLHHFCVAIWFCLIVSLVLTSDSARCLAAQEPVPPAVPSTAQKSVAETKSPAEQKLAEEKRLANEEAALKRKTELLAFAEEHDPQLRTLLEMLETKRPKQFRQALVNLARDTERLSGLQTRDPERYELELRQWKNSQRIQILSARLTLQGNKPEARDELKKLLARRTEIRQESLQLELRRARERVAKLEEQTSKLAKPTEGELEEQVEQILARAKKTGSATPAVPPANTDRPSKGDQR